jgi:putative PIN family toxin of toxin-antitoxin system
VSTLAVYDCMLFFRAATRPSRVHPLFQLVDQGEVVLALGADVLAEVRAVLSRPKLIARYPALTSQAVDAFVAQYLRLAKWVDPTPEHYVLLRDPKDSKYLNLAIEAAAPYLVSDDKDLLDLMDPASVAGLDFRSRYPSVQVVSPSAFLSIVAPPQP